jgi:hypothetical protein
MLRLAGTVCLFGTGGAAYLVATGAGELAVHLLPVVGSELVTRRRSVQQASLLITC